MMTRQLIFVAALVTAAANGGVAREPEPGRWYAVPGSRLDQQAGVFPPMPVPEGNPANILAAWSGAAYDSKRERVLFYGGGHGDYAGNEVYALDVNTFRWSRLWGPSPQILSRQESEGRAEYPDGNPAAVHTYDGLNYLPDLDKLWRGGGSLWSGSGGGTNATWMFDLASNRWQRMADSRVLGVSVASDYDPVTGHVFAYSDKNVLGEYDPKKNRWRELGDIFHGEEQVSAIKKFVGWAGGASLFVLDPVTWTWTEVKPVPGNTVIPPTIHRDGPDKILVMSKFLYIPSKNVYVLVQTVDTEVYIYRLAMP